MSQGVSKKTAKSREGTKSPEYPCALHLRFKSQIPVGCDGAAQLMTQLTEEKRKSISSSPLHALPKSGQNLTDAGVHSVPVVTYRTGYATCLPLFERKSNTRWTLSTPGDGIWPCANFLNQWTPTPAPSAMSFWDKRDFETNSLVRFNRFMARVWQSITHVASKMLPN
jgi:hypothetical protein